MQVEITSEDEMKSFGHKMGRLIRGGECIELIGDIGSGKTTLTKGIAVGLDIKETVLSPTFTINRTYHSPSGLMLSHYDFYRLSDAGIMADEIAESLQDDDTVVVIEWGGVVEAVLPTDRLRIQFESPTENGRIMTLQPMGQKAERLLKGIR